MKIRGSSTFLVSDCCWNPDLSDLFWEDLVTHRHAALGEWHLENWCSSSTSPGNVFEVYFRNLGNAAAAPFEWCSTVHARASGADLHTCPELRVQQFFTAQQRCETVRRHSEATGTPF